MATMKTQITTEDLGDSNSSDTIKVAVMNNDIRHLNDTMSRIEGKFDTAIQSFVTHEKLSDAISASDAKHIEQDKAIKGLEDWNTWAVRILAGGAITFIIYFILQSGLLHR